MSSNNPTMINQVALASTEEEVVVYVAPLPLEDVMPDTAPIGQEAVEVTTPPPQQQPPGGFVNYQPVLRNEFVSLLAYNEEMVEMRRRVEQLEENRPEHRNETDEEEAVEGSSYLSGYLSLAARLFGIGSVSPRTDLNTGTIGLFAVAVVVDPSTHRVKKWLAAFGIFFFVSLEVFVFGVVIQEASHPKCSAVSDCPAGNYCNTDYMTCSDCYVVQRGSFSSVQDFEATCSTVLPADKWEHRAFINADFSEFPLDKKINYYDNKEYECYAFNHCLQSDMDAASNYNTKHCDFIVSNAAKMDMQVWVLIFFLALLWTLPIVQDIEEATIEEVVMDHHLTDSFNGPAEVIRVTLRMRKYLIPFCTTSATVVLLLTDNISSKNIILNFLAISLVLEADNVLAVLFLNARRNTFMKNVVRNVDGGAAGAARASFFWTRVQGFLCPILLIIFLYNVNDIVKDCSELYTDLSFLIWIPALAIFVVQACFSIICGRGTRTVCEQILMALIELVRNLIGFISIILLLLGYVDIVGVANLGFVFVISIICLLIISGLSILRRKCYGREHQE
mmetsp:Transcript_18581/g.37014  ORF Transcript_18581/g.37014 Transcript_18581/m.37014 type:complete len:562 (+) Transcript_18581:98-1783(+)